MRLATLHLGFAGLGGVLATTSAFHDNGPSLGVTRRLGYRPQGETIKVRRGEPAVSKHFDMTHDHWAATLRRDDVELIGVEPVRSLLGLD